MLGRAIYFGGRESNDGMGICFHGKGNEKEDSAEAAQSMDVEAHLLDGCHQRAAIRQEGHGDSGNHPKYRTNQAI